MIRLNLIYLASSILLIVALVTAPWVSITVGNEKVLLPLTALPKFSRSITVDSAIAAAVGVLNFLSTILLIISLFFMLLSTYTEKAVSFAKNSLLFTIVWATTTIMLFSILAVLRRYSLIPFQVSCDAYPSYFYLLVSYALLVAARGFAPQLILRDGAVVPIKMFQPPTTPQPTPSPTPTTIPAVTTSTNEAQTQTTHTTASTMQTSQTATETASPSSAAPIQPTTEEIEKHPEERAKEREKEVYAKVARELLEGE